MDIAPSRRSSGCLSFCLCIAAFFALFLYAVFGPVESIIEDPEQYWSPFSGRLAIAGILAFCLAGLGGGALFTWLLTKRNR
jgi:hypothetical protein